MDRLTSLTAFVRVVDSGGFSAAGRKLNMSTTMVSNHIQALEQRLGARLLNRTTRKVSVTEIGRAYYDRCVQILADIEQADDIAGALQSTPRGTLRIHTPTHMVPFVAPVVNAFLGLYPDVKVDVTIGERNVDMIDEGFDLAVRMLRPPDSSLTCATSQPGGMCCAARMAILKSMVGRSNSPSSPNAIAFATSVIPLARNGASWTAWVRRRRCGCRAISSPTAAGRCTRPRARVSAFASLPDF
jgi:DNA-binding transcriptional LysR family regulator